MSKDFSFTNSLIKETSPYLLQHAHNPVNWHPFSAKIFEIAKAENKPILISIGYSACHWCHVMEHESFEDSEVAKIMNENFINIKVDREERSDVDMLYMQAVQLMTGRGGWPLNCFVLPDGRPFYGGTYFRKTQWIEVLNNLINLYKLESNKVLEYAEALTNGIKQAELISTSNKIDTLLTKELIQLSVKKWKTQLDDENGGPNKSPKFPMPCNYQFLLRYAILEKDNALLNQVNLTLKKMAFGGIYDQLHGGFSRYSTDIIWKVPHFEKMLYDNAQLISLYTEAFNLTKNPLYKEIACDTLQFIENEWYKAEGYFYSAYDADSDGEEGKFYVWNQLDLKDLLGENFDVFSDYFEINDKGYWEHGNYILMRSENQIQLLTKFNLTKNELDHIILTCKNSLKQEAKSRLKPSLDDKTITSWNALICSAYSKAYLSFGEIKYKEIALTSINFITSQLTLVDGKLYRTYKNKCAKIDGFLEDYAFTIEALINVYLISQNQEFLNKAYNLCELTLSLFQNKESDFLYYTNNLSTDLILRTTEISDNVIPSSNSQMAHNLFMLGNYFGNTEWINRSKKMLSNLLEEFKNYGAGYSHWGSLALCYSYPFKEISIVGKHVNENLIQLYKHGVTNAIFTVSETNSDLPFLKNRYVENQTLFYVCENNTCYSPTKSLAETILQLE